LKLGAAAEKRVKLVRGNGNQYGGGGGGGYAKKC
jgi:hypothetical protein